MARLTRSSASASSLNAGRAPPSGSGGIAVAHLHVLEAEAALDAQVAARHVVVVGARDLDGAVVLHVQVEVAAHAAVGADRARDVLLVLAPHPLRAQLVLGAEHQRAGRADGDAVAAVDARGVRQLHGELGRDARVEPAARDVDRERVLVLVAARVGALVTEDALGVVAHVERVVDLDRLAHGRRGLAVRLGMAAGLLVVAVEIGRRRWAVARGVGLVAEDVLLRRRRRGQIHGGGEELHDHPARVVDALGVGLDLHALLGAPRAGRDQGARALELDHAHAARVDRAQRVGVAERGRVDFERPAGVEDRAPLLDLHRAAVDLQRHGARHAGPPFANTSRRPTAERIALAAVWPRPQIEASVMQRSISPSSASSSCTLPRVRPERSRASSSSWRTVPTRQGTHWPHDSSRMNAAIRIRMSGRFTVSSIPITTPEPSVVPASRTASKVSGTSSWSGAAKLPAAPPRSTVWIARSPGTPPASSISSRSVMPNSIS